MAGVTLKYRPSRFPLFPSQAFQECNCPHFISTSVVQTGGNTYGPKQEAYKGKEAVRENDNAGKAERRAGAATNLDRLIDTNTTKPAEGTEGESLRVKAQRLAVQFFLNWRHPDRAPRDPIRQHFYSPTFGNTSPRQSPSVLMPPKPQAQTPSPVSVSVASLPEILVGITARLSNVTFLSIWEINARRLVLFTTPQVPGLTLALDIDRFYGLSISKKVREAQERFSAEER